MRGAHGFTPIRGAVADIWRVPVLRAHGIDTWRPKPCVARTVISALYRRTRSGPEGAGYFRMSRGRWLLNSIPMTRWGQAPMLLAFESLLAARRGVQPSWELRAQARTAHS